MRRLSTYLPLNPLRGKQTGDLFRRGTVSFKTGEVAGFSIFQSFLSLSACGFGGFLRQYREIIEGSTDTNITCNVASVSA